MMQNRASWVAACGVVLLAAGCGGGGGSSVHPLTSTLRSYQVGDQWVYHVAGTWKGALSPSSIPMGGTTTRSISTLNMAGTDYLGVTVFQDLRPQSGMYQERRYTLLRQEAATASIRALGDKQDTGFWRMVIDDPEAVIVPGAWSVGLGINPTTQYENGEHSHYSLSVQGPETVEVHAGEFETYRVAVTEDDPKYGTSTRTEWWHPGLGAPVKYSERRVLPGQVTLDFTATLTSSTVSIP